MTLITNNSIKSAPSAHLLFFTLLPTNSSRVRGYEVHITKVGINLRLILFKT